ncbi:MAG: hypothetical protein P794_08265 [Epsilonproteobacteria bacterium (ex Lamellibrachia satsuma)]|nr:MAG: hypothetical protein P794_08265 [Epsilonproteobacteria bacterium (ex Lamellibrachia satsuma)]
MTHVGKVLSLYISTKESDSPVEKSEIAADTKGIVGDKHYDTNIQRSVLITSIQSYELVKKQQIEIPYGILGENLLIDYNPYVLPIGARLHIGNIILEITQPCTLCEHLSCIDHKLPKLLKNDRGIFAKTIQPGEIKVGDEISLLEA